MLIRIALVVVERVEAPLIARKLDCVYIAKGLGESETILADGVIELLSMDKLVEIALLSEVVPRIESEEAEDVKDIAVFEDVNEVEDARGDEDLGAVVYVEELVKGPKLLLYVVLALFEEEDNKLEMMLPKMPVTADGEDVKVRLLFDAVVRTVLDAIGFDTVALGADMFDTSMLISAMLDVKILDVSMFDTR